MADLRCEHCNWLNKETQKEYVCTNCNKKNSFIKEDIQQSVKGGKK